VTQAAPAPVVRSVPRRGAARTLGRLLLFLIIVGAVGAASFFAGQFYQRRLVEEKAAAEPAPSPAPSPEDPATVFDKKRRDVDRNPKASLNKLSAENGGKPLESSDPELLYLYGRALLLSGQAQDAGKAFEKSLEMVKDRPPHDPLKTEAQVAALVAAFKSGNAVAARKAADDLDKLIRAEVSLDGAMQKGAAAVTP
jgi:cytoskeletal protein RodZ